MSELRTDPIPVTAEYLASDGLTVASLEWPDGPPQDTYTIAVTKSVSIELDRHLPVRPVRISVYDRGASRSAERLATLLGQEFTDEILDTRRVGMAIMHFSLGADSRFAIAERQASDPSTPPILRLACLAMVEEHAALQPPTPLQQIRAQRDTVLASAASSSEQVRFAA